MKRMKPAPLVLLILAGLAMAARREEEVAFGEYAARFGKTYKDEKERAKRFEAYSATRAMREQYQTAHPHAQFGDTKFSDMLDAERAAMLHDLPLKNSPKRTKTTTVKEPRDALSYPTNWNWCEHGACTAIADQGYCGSCWVFAAIGALESQWAIATGQLVNLSQQQAIDCNVQRSGTGCCGGWSDEVYEDIDMYTTAAAYPYVDYYHSSSDSLCGNNLHTCKANLATAATLNGQDEPVFTTAAAIFQYIYDNGPFASGMYVESALQTSYISGIYSCSSTITSYNHEIVVVGYGVVNGVSYLICRNSWSDDWGENGYFRVNAVTGHCGIGRSYYGESVSVRPHVLPGWVCDPADYDAGDECHCDCGAYDPDCSDATATLAHCPASSTFCMTNGTCASIPGWTCLPSAYASGGECNCGCGVPDPDCGSASECSGSVTGCAAGGFCTNVDDDCSYVAGFTCLSCHYGSSDGCQCNCGIRDPDCSTQDSNCGFRETCNYLGVCQPLPTTWSCDAINYNARDGCHCDCGAPDPDCDIVGQTELGCVANEYCDSGVCYPTPPIEWVCDKTKYSHNDGCHCDCGAVDPDCTDDCHAQLFGCDEFGLAVCGNDGKCVNITGWTCGKCWYGTDDACDCGCGLFDPDCVESDDTNSTCDTRTAPVGWSCNVKNYGSGDGCDCNCTIADPDCLYATQVVKNCAENQYCFASECRDSPPESWICGTARYGTGDGCNCNCGAVDPDCLLPCSGSVIGCDSFSKAACSTTGTCIDLSGWTCGVCKYGAGDGCDCNCSIADPDCGVEECYAPDTSSSENDGNDDDGEKPSSANSRSTSFKDRDTAHISASFQPISSLLAVFATTLLVALL